LGLPPKPAFKFKVKTLGCHPNWPEGVSIATPLQNPRLLNCALSLNRDGRVSGTSVIAAKCHRSAIPGCGFEPTVKTLSRHRLAGDIFERGRSFFKFKFKFKFKIKICMVFVFKNAWAAFKTTSN